MSLDDFTTTAEPKNADEYDERAIRELAPKECPMAIWESSTRYSRFVRLTQYYLWYRDNRSGSPSSVNLQDAIRSLLEEEQYEDIERKHLWNNFEPAYDDRADGDTLWTEVRDDMERVAVRYDEWKGEEQTETTEDD